MSFLFYQYYQNKLLIFFGRKIWITFEVRFLKGSEIVFLLNQEGTLEHKLWPPLKPNKKNV